MKARKFFGLSVTTLHSHDHILMTAATVVFCNFYVTRFNLNWFREISCGKVKRMPETVDCLCLILTNEMRGRMAIVAGSYRMVSGFYPAVKLFFHYMTVQASAWLVPKIRKPLAVMENINSQPHAKSNGNRHPNNRFHLLRRYPNFLGLSKQKILGVNCLIPFKKNPKTNSYEKQSANDSQKFRVDKLRQQCSGENTCKGGSNQSK